MSKCSPLSTKSKRDVYLQDKAKLYRWLKDNYLHPYPTDNDRRHFLETTSMTRSQLKSCLYYGRLKLAKAGKLEVKRTHRSASNVKTTKKK